LVDKIRYLDREGKIPFKIEELERVIREAIEHNVDISIFSVKFCRNFDDMKEKDKDGKKIKTTEVYRSELVWKPFEYSSFFLVDDMGWYTLWVYIPTSYIKKGKLALDRMLKILKDLASSEALSGELEDQFWALLGWAFSQAPKGFIKPYFVTNEKELNRRCAHKPQLSPAGFLKAELSGPYKPMKEGNSRSFSFFYYLQIYLPGVTLNTPTQENQLIDA
jgi:hypothetical protein